MHSRLARASYRSGRGFTFVEIMLVIGLISILMVALYAGFKAGAARIKAGATRTMLKKIDSSIQMFRDSTGVYPGSLKDLKVPPTPKVKGWDGPYTDEEAPQDAYKHDIQYHLKPKGSKPPYELYSWGPEEGSPQDEWIHSEA